MPARQGAGGAAIPQLTGLIVVVCRNALPFTKACLPTLKRQDAPVTILAVDNASSDGTAQWLKGQRWRIPGLRVSSLREVHGVAAVWNSALRWAFSHGWNEALVVNNDTELLPKTYRWLAAFAAADTTLGLVSCVSVRERERCVYDGMPFTSRPHPDFSCYLFKRWAFERVGGFDEGFEGAYCEDCDLHVRLHRAGIGAACISLPFLHHASGTLKHADAAEKRRIEACAAKNKEYFRRLYGCYPESPEYAQLFQPVTV